MGDLKDLSNTLEVDSSVTKAPEGDAKALNDKVKQVDENVKSAMEESSIIVGIGASAGGLEALQEFFTATPPDSGMSFVAVMHFAPDRTSLLPEILKRYTPMEVLTASDGMTLKPNTVYVIPAAKDLTISDSRLQLEKPVQLHGVHHPIDRFLRTLAAEMTERAIAVILSGSGTDGAEGVKAVKEAGGVVMVQEPNSAVYSSMPQSAIATGTPDMVLPVAQIPGKIIQIIRREDHVNTWAEQTAELGWQLRAIFRIVKDNTGHDFSSYKMDTILRRIERRMKVNGLGKIDAYIDLLNENSQEAISLSREFLIGVTSFFRDTKAFEALHKVVIPRLFAKRDPDDPVRIWHACCATGEEVYSMAILIREYLRTEKLDAKVQFFATDLDETAVAQARAGLYSGGIAASVGEDRLRTFFVKTNTHYQVVKPLRENIVFAQHNLIKDPPFSRLDLLICRNFLIYLNPEMQQRLISMFHQVLKPGGFLFIGSSETIGRSSDFFSPIDRKWKIFARRDKGHHADKFSPLLHSITKLYGASHPVRPVSTEEPTPEMLLAKTLLEKFSPPCLIVNKKFEAVHLSMRTCRLLEMPYGEPTRDILKMAREELRPALRAGIYKAITEQKPVVFRGVKVTIDGDEQTLNVLVEPINTQLQTRKLAMVIFEPVARHSTAHTAPANEGMPHLEDEFSKDALISQLEDQLRITHEQLQTTIEQLETSNDGLMSTNEELLSINEELQSTNEELETSKEELQALNEELVTVNAELQEKVEELNQANNDMENLLNSSEIATMFLDRQFNIKLFTPAMAGIFNLIQADIGRPFRHLTGTIDWPGLSRDVETVLEKLVPVEREAASLDGKRYYIMRVLPYRTTEGEIDGIIVTFVDITELKRDEEIRGRLSAIVEDADDAIISKNLNGVIQTWNVGAEKIFGYKAEEVIGKHISFLLHPGHTDEVSGILGKIAAGEHIEHYETVRMRKDGKTIPVSLTVSPIKDPKGKIVGASKIAHDVTERKKAEEELRQAKEAAEATNRAKSQFLANMSHELRTPMSGVLGMLELALEGPVEEEQREYLEMAHKSAHSLLRILNDILDMSRIEAGKLAFEEKPFPLWKCVAGAVDVLIPEMRRKGLDCSFSVADEVPERVVGDQVRLRQVLTNLIGNAVKFTERGKVIIEVHGGGKTPAGKQEITFSIIDTGIGIPGDTKEILFKSFSQIDNSNTRRFGGTGLGLAISREIVERMGGFISFESEEGVGSTFSFTVPFMEMAEKNKVKRDVKVYCSKDSLPTAGGNAQGRPRRILLAEDDEITRQMMARFLRTKGFEIDTAWDGLTAVTMWEKGEYDLILMDVQMPNMDGFEATRTIREREEAGKNRVPIIAITAHAFKEDEKQCREIGMDAFISKPVDFKKCLRIISGIFRKNHGIHHIGEQE
jgi:two-component system CheB/CheR fusion protein